MKRTILGKEIKPMGQLESNRTSTVASNNRSKSINLAGEIMPNVSVVIEQESVPETMGSQKKNTEGSQE